MGSDLTWGLVKGQESHNVSRCGAVVVLVKVTQIRKICVLGEWFLSHHGAPGEQKGISPRASLLEAACGGGHLDGVLSINQGQSPPGKRGRNLYWEVS